MSIPFNSRCLLCHLGKAMKTAEAHGDEATAMSFARELMEEYRKAPADVGSPWFAPATADLLHKYYGLPADYIRRTHCIQATQEILAQPSSQGALAHFERRKSC